MQYTSQTLKLQICFNSKDRMMNKSILQPIIHLNDPQQNAWRHVNSILLPSVPRKLIFILLKAKASELGNCFSF